MPDTPDDAPWLPEGAFVVLGACQAEGCDRVGWARPTYGSLALVANTEPDIPPHVVEGVLQRVDWWCPVHGLGCQDRIGEQWAAAMLEGIREWTTPKLDQLRMRVEKGREAEFQYVAGLNLDLPLAVRKKPR